MRGVNVRLRNSRKSEDRHDVDDEDRDAPAHATTSQPADRRIEQVDEQQPEHEGPDSIPGHPEQQPNEDRRADEHGDTRRQRNEPRVVRRSDCGVANGGGGRSRPSASPMATGGACVAGRGGSWAAARGRTSRLVHVPQTTRRGRALPTAGPSRAPPALASCRRPLAGCVPSLSQRDVAVAGRRRSRARPARRRRGPRGPVATQFGAPLPLGMAAERELIDLVLAERCRRGGCARRSRVMLPEGWSLVDLI